MRQLKHDLDLFRAQRQYRPSARVQFTPYDDSDYEDDAYENGSSGYRGIQVWYFLTKCVQNDHEQSHILIFSPFENQIVKIFVVDW